MCTLWPLGGKERFYPVSLRVKAHNPSAFFVLFLPHFLPSSHPAYLLLSAAEQTSQVQHYGRAGSSCTVSQKHSRLLYEEGRMGGGGEGQREGGAEAGLTSHRQMGGCFCQSRQPITCGAPPPLARAGPGLRECVLT